MTVYQRLCYHKLFVLCRGIDIDGSTVGIAYVGTMCRRPSSSGLSQDGGRSLNGVVTTAAHELGHIFNMNHDEREGERRVEGGREGGDWRGGRGREGRGLERGGGRRGDWRGGEGIHIDNLTTILMSLCRYNMYLCRYSVHHGWGLSLPPSHSLEQLQCN